MRQLSHDLATRQNLNQNFTADGRKQLSKICLLRRYSLHEIRVYKERIHYIYNLYNL